MAIDNFRKADIILDSANGYIMDEHFAKVGDISGRDLIVQISNNGVIEDQSELSLVLAWTHKQIKNTGMEPFTPIDVSQGLFMVTYPKEMMNPGRVLVNIGISVGDKITFSRNFMLQVEDNAGSAEAAITSDSWTILQQGIKDADVLRKELELSIGELEAKYGSSLGDLPGFREWDTDLILKMKNEFYERGINPKWFGALGDGESDDTAALQAAIDYLKTIGGGSIYLPPGRFNYTNILIRSPHIKLTGPGMLLNGHLNVGDDQLKRLYVEIDGVTFSYETLATGNNAIVGQNAHDVTIRNAHFENCDSAIYINPIKTDHAQHCALWKIHHCSFKNVNYALNIDRDPEFTGDGYTTGDFSFTDNYVYANLYHIYVKGIDGFIFDHNVCFFPNVKEKNQIKVSNIYIRMGHYINIANSSLFEAGDWAVQLYECGEVNVHHNNIAWPGQRVQAGGIMMAWGSQNKTALVESIIESNIIDSPSGIGVVAQDGTENLTITGNRVINFGSNAHYYGTPALGTAYGIAVAGTSKNNHVSNNTSTGTGNWINSGAIQSNVIDGNLFNGKRAPVLSVFTTKDNLNTLPVNYDVINIANTADTTISHMGEGYEGQQLLIRVFDGRTTMVSDGHQVLKSLTTRKFYVNEAILFRYSFGQWVEL